jgi:hypothetical protein
MERMEKTTTVNGKRKTALFKKNEIKLSKKIAFN